jgi:uncharacterized membrane protein YczE
MISDLLATFIKNAFVFTWPGWRRFLRDFVVIQIGFLLFGLAIVIMVKADLGTSPWVALEVALVRRFPITLGQAAILVAAVIILLDIMLREPLGWGSLANMVSIGLWVDWLQPWVPAPPPVWWLQTPYLLLGVLIMGFATALYVGVRAGAGPRDSLMLATARLFKVSVRTARTLVEIVVVTVGWLLGGSIGIGTLLFALCIGPAVQLAFRVMRVRPLQKTVPGTLASPPTATNS